MKKISFIIPAYNAAKYIENVVESIIPVSKLCDIEILIIENGSTDNTLDLSKKLSMQYECVDVFSSDKGVSSARNLGISKASGQWLSFVDADDYVYHEELLGAINELSDEIDFLICGYKKGNSIIDTDYEREKLANTSLDEVRAYLIANPTRFMAVWGKFIRTQVVKSNNLFFNKELSMAEDSDFLIAVTKYCRKINFSKYVIYDYAVSGTSTVRSYDKTKVKKYIAAMEYTSARMNYEPLIVKKAFDRYILMHLNLSMVHETFSVDNNETFSKKVKTLKEIANVEIYKNAIKNTKVFQCKSARMLPILLIKLHMAPLAGLIYKIRAQSNARRK